MPSRKIPVILILVVSLLLSACSSSLTTTVNPSLAQEHSTAAPPSLTPLPSATLSPLPSEVPTSTLTFTPSPTSSPTSSPEPSQTATATPTSTPPGFQPGIYGVGGCKRITFDIKWWVDLCVLNIIVQKDQTMVVNVTWLPIIPGKSRIIKFSDAKNPNMFLTDDLGNHYSFIALGGDAAQDVFLIHERTLHGSYIFPPALPGAWTFAFHSSDNGVTIENMLLDKPAIAIYEWRLPQSGLVFEYREDIWELQTGENGKPILSYLLQENCQLQEMESSKPIGKFKNTIVLGPWTFEIYSRLEETWGFREYRLVAGPPEDDLPGNPIILARIPLSDNLPCLNELSTLLSKLHIQNPAD